MAKRTNPIEQPPPATGESPAEVSTQAPAYDRETRPGDVSEAVMFAMSAGLSVEPDTVDLADPGRFHAPSEPPQAEPDTRVGEPGPAAAAAGSAAPLLTRDAVTGKFHLHPGDGVDVRLNGQAVGAPTELRRGDRLEIGGAVFEFLA